MQNTSGGDTDDGEKKNDDDECRCANKHRCGFLTFLSIMLFVLCCRTGMPMRGDEWSDFCICWLIADCDMYINLEP